MLAYFAGFGLGLSLIFAIGAQNAFVLKQGLQRQHVFLVCAICAGSDAILIGAGVGGFATFLSHYPWVETWARYAGAALLLGYASLSFHSAAVNRHRLTVSDNRAPASKWKVAALTLAFTWLNPHVYLDTVLLIGGISTQFADALPQFTSGAITASFVFFFSLGYGARLLTPIFERPSAWRVFETCLGLLMTLLAIGLIWG
ncbi:LysE/ArgO family amino acid transporter [Paraferrimonas sedimenticola]|uniref:Amino acid transporter n=1 Tax=Paraferrimonas sedimenticola TaxID=375674 RepID=A0AA37S072_9GAMM|nr:LysE/ArgO family amino acid transporter [Paraferrimonas sedimenticola]GLP97877.1 amino acid transporter [Paraferrimonas sedimenticola]